MRILVTGANGQLGNEMQMLAKENPQHLYYFTDVQELDICDKEAVWSYISEKQIDVIVNCAAYTAVDKAEDDRELAHKLNSVAPGILARAAQANNAAMIQVSTEGLSGCCVSATGKLQRKRKFLLSSRHVECGVFTAVSKSIVQHR